MKVQYVSICPTEKAEELGCYSFTPELLASVGARYSRNNEGLDAIASKIDKTNLDKSVDSIFKMLDYGHASIADMTPIAMFIDDITLYAAYYLWTLSPTAGGQECSTRYIKLGESGVATAEELGIPERFASDYEYFVKNAFKNYDDCLNAWTEIANSNPHVTKIPKELLNSTNPKDIKAVERMKRNYAFDRARVHLPVSAKTGVMMVQSARAWASIASHLRSHTMKELVVLGKLIAENLEIGAPRLTKHTKPTLAFGQYIDNEFVELMGQTQAFVENKNDFEFTSVDCFKTDTFFKNYDMFDNNENVAKAFKTRENRYSIFGNVMQRIAVTFSWMGISFGEIRDLNRHRTGNRYCALIPLGFYDAVDQLEGIVNIYNETIINASRNCQFDSQSARNILLSNCNSYIYFTKLGTQYYFEHTTMADKFIYEMELRTGVGAHYKYAEHCHDALKLWYNTYPETKGLVKEGSAEPE
jgi:thymidylate synthase ThyX